MTELEKAARLMLEALEDSYSYVEEEAESVERMYGKYPTRQARIQGLKDEARKHWEAIEAGRRALEQQPADDCAFQIELKAHMGGGYPYPAWVNTSEMERLVSQLKKVGDRLTLYTRPQPATWVGLTDEEILVVARDHYNPRQRPELSFARAIEAKLREKNGGKA